MVELRAHAQLRRRTASPNRRQSLPHAPNSSPSSPRGNNKYPTDPIRDRARGGVEKPSPPPKISNPPQAPYKKTFIAMLRGSKDSKKRKSVDRSSGSESPPVTPQTPPFTEGVVNRSMSMRAPTTPPPQLLPRQTNPPIPPPVGPKNFRPKSLDSNNKDPNSRCNHSHLHHQHLNKNHHHQHSRDPTFHSPDFHKHVRPRVDTNRAALVSRSCSGPTNSPATHNNVLAARNGSSVSQSSGNVQQSIQNFQALQRAGLVQPFVRLGSSSSPHAGGGARGETSPRLRQPVSHAVSGHSGDRLMMMKKTGSREPSLGLLTHEVQQFDHAEPLSSHGTPPTISHALVYTHPNNSPQHALVINPAFLSPHS